MKKFILSFIGFLMSSHTAQAEPQTFKMYSDPHHIVRDPHCDVFTRLVIDVDGREGYALLSDQLMGNCAVDVPANKRSYNLVLRQIDCGTYIYEQSDETIQRVEVIDNRKRLCDNLVPAQIVLNEYQNGKKSVLYSVN